MAPDPTRDRPGRPRAVVFDIGNVLVDWRPERLYARLIPDAAERARFLGEICTHAWNEGFDRGAPMPEGVEAHAARHPGHAALIRAWWADWPEMFGPEISGAVACLRALKARGVPVFGLTNFAAETFAIAQARHPVLTEFDLCVVSAHERAIKPEPGIYAILEARCGLPPEALFFTDDRPENVAAAEARGWRGHVFAGAAGLAEALAGHGLLPPEVARAAAVA
jgi:2-haloacid dehalogenase